MKPQLPNGGQPLVALAIVALALLLRAWGLSFGLPLAESRPDEMTIAYQAMKFGTFDFNPHSFNYPSLWKYVDFVIFGVWYVLGKILGIYGGQEDFLRDFFAAAPPFRLAMRAMGVAMGTLGVALLTRRSLYGAFFFAVAFLHVRDSHFGVTDVPMVTIALAAVLATERLWREGTVKVALVAGILAGLATSTKYNGALLSIPITLSAALAAGATVRSWFTLSVVAAVAMVGAFLLGTPYAALDFHTFWRDFSFEANHLLSGQHVDVGGGYFHHLTASLRYGLGIPLLLAGLVGIVAHLRSNWREAAVLYSFPIVYYLFIGRGETAFFRYILPVVPFLCLSAGLLVERLPTGRRFLALAIALIPLSSSIQADRLMGREDTREAMGQFIEANVPDQGTIVHGGSYSGAPMLQRNVVNQTREYAAKEARADTSGFRKPDDLRWYQKNRRSYDVLFVAQEGFAFASQLPVAEILADPPEWLLLEEYGLVHYSFVPPEIRSLATERYLLAHEESAGEGAGIFDQQDALYLPVAAFGDYQRMGPTLRLYRRQE